MSNSQPEIIYLSGKSVASQSGLAGIHARLLHFALYLYLVRFIQTFGPRGRTLVIGAPYLWLLLFFFIPFLIVLKISFSEVRTAIPPYAPLFEWIDNTYLRITLNLENYQLFWQDDFYFSAYLNSLQIAFTATIIALFIGYPVAYAISRAPREWRNLLIMLVILPFWTSLLIRVYAWVAILKTDGLLNHWLLSLGLIQTPLVILNTPIAVYIGIVYSYLPFMILPLYANLEKMDQSLIEAALDLGCTPLKAFWTVVVPLSFPGILAGCFLVFIPTVGEFVIPDLLGGSDTLMIGKVLWTDFFNNRDWPIASALAILLLLTLVIPIMFFQHLQTRENP